MNVLFDPRKESFPQRVAVLVSGRGSNLKALLQQNDPKLANFCGVFCSDPGQPAEAIARSFSVPVISAQSSFHQDAVEHRDTYILKQLQAWKAQWILLAGYRRLIGPKLLKAFPYRILNIHPSLLPSFPGQNAQQQAWEYGAKFSGATVHFVDEQVDHGPIITQAAVPIDSAASSDDVAELLLKAEHQLYTQALQSLLRRGCKLTGRRVEFLV